MHGNKVMTLYHVTNEAGADGIRSGKKMNRGRDGMFGGGITYLIFNKIHIMIL